MARSEDARFRVCNVNYLNSVPYRKVITSPIVDYAESDPAECARRLHEDECDIALVPLAEFAAVGRYHAMPYGIASHGPAETVLFASNTPPSAVTSVLLDTASQTSVILLRVVLHEISANPTALKFTRSTPANSAQLIDHGVGALVIGNSAFEFADRYEHVIDLGQAWYNLTGLPFVFAVWAGLPDRLTTERVALLRKEFDDGLANRAILARHWADKHSFSRDVATSYLRNTMVYRLGESERAGAVEFLRVANERGLLPKCDLTFVSELVPTKIENIVSHGSNGTAPHEKRSGLRTIDAILSDASLGQRLSVSDALRLTSDASFADLALAADIRRRQLHQDGAVSYIIDRNINYTNVCNVYCRFCAFYRAPGKSGGYLLSHEEIGNKIEEMVKAGGIQILLQGGLNPELGIEYYEDLFRYIKERYPINLHALSADEIVHITKVSNISMEETLKRLIDAGLGSLPGGGAEILVDRIRQRIARLKTSTAEWLEVHRTAHRLGLRSTCTMMFGVKETWEDRLLHLLKLRQLQDETEGFTAFITWPFQEENTKLKRGDTSAPEYLRVQAISRLLLDNIPNIQSSWVTQGPAIGQIALFFGANDFGSVMFEENVVSAAGTTYRMDAPLIEAHIRQAGFKPWRRNIHYQASVS